MNTIQIDHLSKRYRGQSRPALNDVSLTISAGMFGLLGKNGAGKSTLMRILTTLDQATTGTVQLCGIPITQRATVRNQVGYLPQNFGFYPNMTVRDALTYLAILAHVPTRSQHRRINALLAQVNLIITSTSNSTRLPNVSMTYAEPLKPQGKWDFSDRLMQFEIAHKFLFSTCPPQHDYSWGCFLRCQRFPQLIAVIVPDKKQKVPIVFIEMFRESRRHIWAAIFVPPVAQ